MYLPLFLCRQGSVRRSRTGWIHLAGAGLGLLSLGTTAWAGNLTRSGVSNNPGSPGAALSQTTTAATTATAQVSQEAVLAQRAQVSLQRSILSLQAIQAQASAQSAARNLMLTPTSANNLGTVAQPLSNVPDGLAVNGLVPGIKGTDPANPATNATTVPVTIGAGGTASVVLAANSAITLPPGASGNTQISVSGTGTVGTITTGGTITPLTGGAATIVPPGGTISLTNGGTITFAGGSPGLPSTFSTYSYASAGGTSSVPSSWSGIGGLTQSTFAAGTGPTSGATTVTVTQTAQQALLTWQSFNIGKNTTLDFDQSLGGADVGNWVAINKVADDVSPSQILGAIQAPGQVYVINQNGIIFGGSSQVNVGTLVASSLPINTNLVQNGLLNNPDLQYLFSQLDIPAGSQGPTGAFTPQGTSAATATAPAPGSYNVSGGLISQVDASGNLTFIGANGQDGDVVVQAGAQLSSPTTPENVGGRIALVGPNVNNSGTISTPDGQTILAAGLQVGLAAHPASDPSLRGLDVSIGAISDPGYAGGATGVSGTAVNNGTIDIPRADLTVAGANVQQNGVVAGTTSVTLNGRVDLLADYNAVPLTKGENGFQGTSNFYPTSSGTVLFGPDSLTEILPELSDTGTVVGTELALSSLVNVQGGSIYLGPGSMLVAPSAALPSSLSQPGLGVDAAPLTAGVSLSAGNWLSQGNGSYALTYTSGQVYLDSDALIDVSGSENVAASAAEDFISAQLLGTELANFPLQQTGALRGSTINVDILQTGNYDGSEWIGTPIGDISGYVNLIGRTVGELTTAGGTVAINAGSSTVLQSGSGIDVSGGWINYQSTSEKTTSVVSNGLVYNIAQATPDAVYSGVYNGASTYSPKYGIGQSFNSSLQGAAQNQPGFLQGGAGGSLSITTPAAALDGSLLGTTVAGMYQRTPASQVTAEFTNTSGTALYASSSTLPTMLDLLAVPTPSTLTLAFQAQNPSSTSFAAYSPTPPNILFQSDDLPAVGAFGSALSSERLTEFDLSPTMFGAQGIGSLKIVNDDGDITLPSGSTLTSAVDGSISMSAANIDLEGSVSSPSGSLSFTVYNLSPYATPVSNPAPDPTRGDFTLGAGASLSAAGLDVDDRPASPGAGSAPTATAGGNITIDAYDIDLVPGAGGANALDVSGGVDIGTTGQPSYGKAGSLVIEAGQDPLFSSILGGRLSWNQQLTRFLGFSGSQGGSLTIKAPLIQVGGSTLLNGDTLASGNTLWLDETNANGSLSEPEFFSQGGFTSFTLDGIGEAVLGTGGAPTSQYLPATLIAPGTTINPQTQNIVASLDGNTILLTRQVLATGLQTPVNLAFNDPGAKDPFLGVLLVRGDFVMGKGSVIRTGPQTTSSRGVTINANTAAVLGSIIAPGGTIDIAGGNNSNFLYSSSAAVPTVDLGPNSYLSTAGAVNLVPNALGYSTGSVLNGGTINISGNIVAEAGSVLDVSGTSGTIDLPPGAAGVSSANLVSSNVPVPIRVDSSGGSIILTGDQELFTDATLRGAAGGPTAQGGSLSVSSGIYLPIGVQSALNPTLTVTQDGTTIPVAGYYPAGETALGNAVVDGTGAVVSQRGYFAADGFNSGGFGSLTLGGSVQFSGNVSITADQSISVGNGGVILGDSVVSLTAPYVDLGMAFQSPLPVTEESNIFQAGGAAFYFGPTYGTGVLNVTANLIDVGDLSMQGFGMVRLTAANGDIRGDGTFDLAGNLELTAGQVYPTTDNSFTIAVYDYNGTAGDGGVTIDAGGTRPLPFSAGGALDIYASNIVQDGVLRAPLGTINLGSGVTGAVPVDYITGSGVTGVIPAEVIPSTQSVTLGSGSMTSVSAVDPATGQALVLPYGTNANGVTYKDPAGNDITTAGNGVDAIPTKAINISGTQVVDQAGSGIDVSGGGDLFSYSFVTGTGGTNDTLASNGSFAIIPGYGAAYAPYYSASDYVNSSLSVGEQVYLNASHGLPAGVYTLLPARYALIPGAFLITPKSGVPPVASVAEANGTSLVSGYEFNGFNSGRSGQGVFSAFEIESPAAVAARANYDILTANTFLSQSAAAAGLSAPRLPLDAGQLVLAATASLSIDGSVNSQPGAGGLGGLVDIASPSPILISGPNTDLQNLPASTLVLDSADLSAFGADSLLIGGFRESVSGGDSVTVTTSSLTVDNQGSSVDVNGQTLDGLSAPDITLVSNATLTLAPGAEIFQSAPITASGAATLFLTGDGTFLRVSSSPDAKTVRSGANPSDTNPSMVIGAGAIISGPGGPAGSITLDSTHATSLDPTATITARTVNLDSGAITLNLGPDSTSLSGLVLSGSALSTLQSTAQTLSLLSYSSIDIYGSGEIGGAEVDGVYPVSALALHAAEIDGVTANNGGGGTVVINAGNVSLDNGPDGAAPSVNSNAGGSLTINANTIDLGTNQTGIDQYANVVLNASGGIVLDPETKVTNADTSVVTGTGGLTASNNLTINAPFITANSFSATQAAANETISATGGSLVLDSSGAAPLPSSQGLGATLHLEGQSVTANNEVVLPSGDVDLHAADGDVSIGGTLNVAGTALNLNDVVEYASAGQITLKSNTGSITLADAGSLDLSGASGGGNAGTLTISAPGGTFNFGSNTITGSAATGAQAGTFSLDVAGIAGGNLANLNAALDAGSFHRSVTIRDRTDANVAVNGDIRAGIFDLSADAGSITVNGTIDASNLASTDSNGNPILIGGTVDLTASGGVTLAAGSELDASGVNFSNAGQGGSVTLTAGAETNGNFNNVAYGSGPMVTIQGAAHNLPAADINLSVADATAGSASVGKLTGTLTISAPQTAGNTDLQVAPISGTIQGASSIVLEGNQVFVAADGSIDNQEAGVYSNGQIFAGNTAAILSRIYQGNSPSSALSALTSVEPGAEIINPNGNLTLASTWDLSTYRFGPGVSGVDGSGAPGALTLRASGNIIFDFGASLTDGFDTANTSFSSSGNPVWTAPLLPAGEASWSYTIASGADFTGADVNDVQSLAALNAGGGGSVLLGEGAPALPTSLFGAGRGAVLANMNFFQTIRTGTGNITIDAGGDVQLLNNLATIYTAGTQVGGLAGFTTPTLGTVAQAPAYGPQYSMDGGNVAISAQGNIAHLTASGAPDSSLELPTTWLYRQGAINSTGQFALKGTRGNRPTESTSWWVDFSNFFEGVGALGGGNVTLKAGESVDNVDAVVPTNERTTAQVTVNGAVDTLAADQTALELGGGNLVVEAGENINGGAYYVERGQGTISAGNQILTNSTRAAIEVGGDSNLPINWLPTALFLGVGSFDVTAGSDLLLGPVANPFLLPQGVDNTTINKSYFSTYGPTDSVNVSSLGGAVTLKDDADGDAGSLADFYNNVYIAPNGQSLGTSSQPWLGSVETAISAFSTVAALMPPTLNAVSFSSDVDVVGSLTLSPSSTGTIDLVAAGALNGFQINQTDLGSGTEYYGSSTINLSDANPGAIPGIFSPLSSSTPNSLSSIYSAVNDLFAESGATAGLVLQTREALHANINGLPLHAGDPNPVHLSAGTGNISGFTVYTPKAAEIIAGEDISDIALYVQNVNASDVSVVAAGRDITAYDPGSSLRLVAQASGNAYIGETPGSLAGAGVGGPDAGDIQISGPGALEVLAGRDLNLGVGPENANGTEEGITSIGNIRNPTLPFGGADVIAGAGIGPSVGFNDSLLNFGNVSLVNGAITPDDPSTYGGSFIGQFLNPDGSANSNLYLPELGAMMNLPSGESDSQVFTAFSQLSPQNQDVLALNIFYLTLRDAGRDHNKNLGNYATGYRAIAALFPTGPQPYQGDISLTSREIKTTNGGDISLLAPGGQLTVGYDIAGNQPQDQGVLTEDGGNINIFTEGNVNVGTSRIFTLHGGNEIIWSTDGDIAAGSSSKTVQSAPPTRVVVDPQSGDVQTDLAGLATGGGIGVLETVVGAPPADIDLIAPNGTVDAGDAGIRVSGNLSIAAVRVLNAGNISVGGKSSGVPTTSAPTIAGLSAASSAAGSTTNAENQAGNQGRNQQAQQQQIIPSIITVEVLGYGGEQ